MVNVVGDIGGRYDTLMALLDKMPKEDIISVGDMIDRGPKSKEVVDFFMNNSSARAILGNHEHIMLDYYGDKKYYGDNIWTWQGGQETLDSFGGEVPKSVRAWISNLPKFLQIDKFLISHAFLPELKTLDEACELGSSIYGREDSIIWNRSYPIRRAEFDLQIAGHNSHYGFRWWQDNKGKFAVCLDSSREKVLTGINLPTLEIFQQEFID